MSIRLPGPFSSGLCSLPEHAKSSFRHFPGKEDSILHHATMVLHDRFLAAFRFGGRGRAEKGTNGRFCENGLFLIEMAGFPSSETAFARTEMTFPRTETASARTRAASARVRTASARVRTAFARTRTAFARTRMAFARRRTASAGAFWGAASRLMRREDS